MYVYLCTYVCMYAFICVCIYLRIYMCIAFQAVYMYMCVCSNVCIYIHIYILMHMYVKHAVLYIDEGGFAVKDTFPSLCVCVRIYNPSILPKGYATASKDTKAHMQDTIMIRWCHHHVCLSEQDTFPPTCTSCMYVSRHHHD
jgi:hypothetical protein